MGGKSAVAICTCRPGVSSAACSRVTVPAIQPLHRFYQYVETGCQWSWGLMWGHAVSRDLVTWEHLPPAIVPSFGGFDGDGCFSGCATLDENGVPTILYTGVCGWRWEGRALLLARCVRLNLATACPHAHTHTRMRTQLSQQSLDGRCCCLVLPAAPRRPAALQRGVRPTATA